MQMMEALATIIHTPGVGMGTEAAVDLVEEESIEAEGDRFPLEVDTVLEIRPSPLAGAGYRRYMSTFLCRTFCIPMSNSSLSVEGRIFCQKS